MKPHFLGNCLHCGAKPGFPHHKYCSSISKNRSHCTDCGAAEGDLHFEGCPRVINTVPEDTQANYRAYFPKFPSIAPRIWRDVMNREYRRHLERMDTKDPAAHYRRAVMKVAITDEDIARGYVEVNLDPYRVAKEHDMRGGPREQIMKKTLRFTHKGDTEAKVVADIRSALERWEKILEEDGSVPCNT